MRTGLWVLENMDSDSATGNVILKMKKLETNHFVVTDGISIVKR